MAFRILHADVTHGVPDLSDVDRDDVALVLKDEHRPVGLLFVERQPAAHPDDGVLVTDDATVVSVAAFELLNERVRCALLAREVSAAEASVHAEPSVPGGVTVVVCTRNRPDDLGLCLDSILAAEGSEAADVLVVDNAPPDDRTRDVVAERPNVRYLREPVAGLDVARNCALAHAQGAWIVFVDDDARVDRWWLHGLAAALAEHPDASAVTGLVLPAQLDTPAQIRFERSGGFGRGYEQVRWDGRHGPGTPLHPFGAGIFGAGCNMAFDVSRMRQLGGFNDALDTGPPLPGGGDLDAFFRVLHAGHVLVYEPRMAVFHRHRRGNDELRKQYYSWGLGFMAFLGAHWSERSNRASILRMWSWWMLYSARRVSGTVRSHDLRGLGLALSEFHGGLVGFSGEYQRSQRRMEQRRIERQSTGGREL